MTLEPMILIAMMFLIVTILYVSEDNKDSKTKEFDQLEEEIDILNNLIISKQEQFLSLERDVKNLKEQKDVIKNRTLPKKAEEVLQEYENNYIKIPFDIVDDLATKNFQTKKDMFQFIETERKNWVLENRKQLRKKV